MKPEDVKIGLRVKANESFCDVPEGTQGVIDELYTIGSGPGVTGFMVAWDLPSSPLPKGYDKYDGKPAFETKILRDGFNLKREAYLVDLV